MFTSSSSCRPLVSSSSFLSSVLLPSDYLSTYQAHTTWTLMRGTLYCPQAKNPPSFIEILPLLVSQRATRRSTLSSRNDQYNFAICVCIMFLSSLLNISNNQWTSVADRSGRLSRLPRGSSVDVAVSFNGRDIAWPLKGARVNRNLLGILQGWILSRPCPVDRNKNTSLAKFIILLMATRHRRCVPSGYCRCKSNRESSTVIVEY